MTLVLASASPRRRAILATLGVTFRVVPSHAAETARAHESAGVLARRLAEDKARDVAACERGFVLGADTVVAVDGVVLGKPVDDADAARLLRMFSWRCLDEIGELLEAPRRPRTSAPPGARWPRPCRRSCTATRRCGEWSPPAR